VVNKVEKIAVRRADIWVAKLPYNTGDLLQGEHPVLILSNHRSNKSSNFVTIIPLTSTIGSSPSNVIIGTEFGLKNKSCLLTNQTQTLSKDLLLFKVCFITTPKMDEAMHVLAIHLGIKNMGVLEMFKIYEDKKNDIRSAKCQGNYELMERLTEKYLKDIYEMSYVNKGEDIMEELEWCYYNLALAKHKNGKTIEAYNTAKKALTFKARTETDLTYTRWLVGSTCMELGDDFVLEGSEMFEQCITFYDQIKEERYKILSQFNKAQLLKDVLAMKVCLENYKNNKFKPTLFSFGDMEKDSILEAMEMELSNIL
jgi:mRNA-degrading endonuclease toxin of MazEF toxin-antitoxin module